MVRQEILSVTDRGNGKVEDVAAIKLRSLAQDLITSYESRFHALDSLFDTSRLVLCDLHESLSHGKEQREEISSGLRDILAKNEHLRKKDFDNMMQAISSAQDQREMEVRNLLRDYFDEQKGMAGALRAGLRKFKDSLAKGEAQRVEEFQAMMKEILSGQDERKKEVTSMLKGFQEQQHQMLLKLRTLLAKGRDLRIKDLQSMLKEFQHQRKERKAFVEEQRQEVRGMLADFKKERVERRNKSLILAKADGPKERSFT